MDKKQAIYLEWVDSKGGGGWEPLDGFEPKIMTVHSIGWLVQEDKKQISISAAYGIGPPQAMDIITIPKCAIQKRKIVKIGKVK